MLSNRARSRVLLGAVVMGLGGLSVASCGGSDSKKVFSGDAGEAGESGNAGAPTSTGGGPTAGGPTNGAGQSNGGSAPADDGGFGGSVGGFGGTVTEPAAGAAGFGGEVASCSAEERGRIKITFDTIDPERVLSLQWVDSAAATTPSVTGQGGPLHCDDPQEFFGQSYGAPEGTSPGPVVGGFVGTAVNCGADITITSAAKDCTQTVQQLPVTTQYHFYGGAQASQMRITRSFGFDASNSVFAGTTGLRPFVPRVTLNHLNTVIYPNLPGTAVSSTLATACGGDCFVPTGTTWNGKWFADIEPSTGLALIVLRDPTMTSPVDLTVNYDSFSNSNLASFVILQPAQGWKAPVTEVEYLCFADLVTWPQTSRDAAQLPAGCGP